MEELSNSFEKVPMPADLMGFVNCKKRSRLEEVEANDSVMVFYMKLLVKCSSEEEDDVPEDSSEDEDDAPGHALRADIGERIRGTQHQGPRNSRSLT